MPTPPPPPTRNLIYPARETGPEKAALRGGGV